MLPNSFNVIRWKTSGLVCVIFFTLKTVAQQKDSSSAKWQYLLKEFKTGKIDYNKYVDKVDSLVMTNYGDVHLKEHLETYKMLVWKYNNQAWRKQQYYWFLRSNAEFNNQYGKALFYTEKQYQELGKKDINLELSGQKIYLFATSDNYERAIAEYNYILPKLNQIPSKISQDSLSQGSVWSALTKLTNMCPVYTKLNDTVSMQKLQQLASRIYDSAKTHPKYAREINLTNEYLLLINYNTNMLTGNTNVAEKCLQQALTISNLPDSNLNVGVEIKGILLATITDFYIIQKNKDSAAFYLQMAEALGKAYNYNPVDAEMKLLTLKGRLQKLEGNYEGADESLQKRCQILDSVYKIQTIEIADNMYAQAAEENSREALGIINKQKEQRTLLALIIGLLLLLSIIGTYLYLKKRETLAKKKVEEIEHTTQLQIAELEERNRMTKKAEQKRLGMELHDDLAGQLAYIKNVVEDAILDCHDQTALLRFKNVSNLLADTYQTTRHKSHEWFNAATESDEAAFCERIGKLMGNALPTSRYQSEIIIDEHSIAGVDLSIKIEMLRIIQEAVINILKHAKASNVSLLIYQEANGLVLRIKDDGKGFSTQQNNSRSGLGLKSIQERVVAMHGHMEIVSRKTGTEIIITMPINAVSNYF